MAQGKYQKNRQLRKRRFSLLLSLVLLLTLTVGGTLAFVAVRSATVRNQFEEAFVTSRVNQNFTVTNTGDVDAYIRAAVVVNYEVDGGISAVKPVYDTDYTLTCDSSWTEDGGFYYYQNIVPSLQATATAPVTVNNLSGKRLRVEVVAEAIQADGMGADDAVAAWAVANVAG